MSSFDRSLLQIFSSEQAELLDRMRTLIRAGDPGGHDELLRCAHTLKGAARAVGMELTESLVHYTEDVLVKFRAGTLSLDEPARRVLNQAFDAAEDILAAAQADRDLPDISGVLSAVAELAGASPVVPGVSIGKAPEPPTPAPRLAELVRVDAESLDELIRKSSQLLVVASGEAARQSELTGHAAHLEETRREWLRLRRNCARVLSEHRQSADFAPVAECLSYMNGQLDVLNREARSAAAARQQSGYELHRRAEELHQDASRIRMTPAEAVFAGFGPMVRDLAHEEGREVNYSAEGLEFQADRLVLQGLRDPVLHLLRNAVSHGIETAAERLSAGKAAAGSIQLRIESRGDRLRIAVEDDGRGIERADGAGSSDPGDLSRFLLTPGFSTARVITKISGRGMGLAIVQQAVNKLQGEVTIRPGVRGGTSIAISVPLSISTQHVLLISAGGYTYGVPANFVESVCRTGNADVRNISGRESIMAGSLPVPLARLSELLGLPPASAEEKALLECVVLISGDERAAMVVDQLLDEREVVIKDTGLPPSMAGLSAGAVPLDDGNVAVMLNVAELFAKFRQVDTNAAAPLFQAKAQEIPPLILVVDDSLTTRSLEKGILEAKGYRVQVAIDGLQALEMLRRQPADLVISDVMMPRLTGFQLLEQIKASKDLKHIPVILVTSRESREERELGLSLGADAYIVKRKFDQRELMDIIRQIL